MVRQRPICHPLQSPVKLIPQDVLHRVHKNGLPVLDLLVPPRKADAVPQGIAAPVSHQPVNRVVHDLHIAGREVRLRQPGHVVNHAHRVFDADISASHVLFLVQRLLVFVAIPVGNQRLLNPLRLISGPFVVLKRDNTQSPSPSCSSFSSCSSDGTMTSASHCIVLHSLLSRSSWSGISVPFPPCKRRLIVLS